MVRLIISGSRDFYDYGVVNEEVCFWWLDHDTPDIEVVSGCARGVDRLGERVAGHQGFPVKRFRAKWDKYGKPAGPIRNRKMAKYADALLAFPSKESTGTRDMIEQAEAAGLDVTVVEI